MGFTTKTNNTSSSKTPTKEEKPKADVFSGYLLLFLILLLGLVIRCYNLTSIDIWFDEAAILFQTEMTFAEIWSFSASENFPPLYQWLLKLWSYLGSSIERLRLLSVIIGSLTPLIFFLIGRELFNRKYALLYGLLSVLSVPLIYYSQNIRMYSLFILLCSLSYLGFIKALKTNEWKYWILVAVSNLLGYYTFLFMVFVIAGEFLVLLSRYRFRFNEYARFLYPHIIVLMLMFCWIIPFYERYTTVIKQVQTHVTIGQIVKVFFYLGTGTHFLGKYLLAAILNLPFALGLFIGIRELKHNKKLTALTIIFCFTLISCCIISTLGPNIFYGRYLLFLLPIYFAIILHGYSIIKDKIVRVIALSVLVVSLLSSNIYYFTHYLQVHDEFRYLWYEVERVEGHSFSLIAKEVEDQIAEREVIIHYSNPKLRSFSFFPLLYYHGRKLPEYIYSKNDLPSHAGQQYLKPGELLRSLEDLDELPKGIWIITLNSLEFLTEYNTLTETTKPSWFHRENLLSELDHLDYRHDKSFSIGNVTTVHFVKVYEEEDQTGKKSNSLE
jgi:hypothetical protein